jgi:hypothetical protein
VKIGDRYVFYLGVVALLIALPGGIARLFGASVGVLASIAAVQIFVVLAFFATSLVSVAFGIRAAVEKKWRSAVTYGGATLIPLATWCSAAVLNDPGWQAVMGI